MSQRIPVADWAAQVPVEGVIGLLAYIQANIGTVRINLSQINQSGATNGQVVTWVNALNQYVARTPSTGGGGTTIKNGDSPAVATRKRPNGQPGSQFEDIWFRWQYNVRLYGATGNGVTDDSGAVAQALAALTANGGGNLYFPEGYYKGLENIGGISVPCSISGDGIGQSVLNFGTTGGLSFSAGTSVAAFEVRGVTLEAADIGISADGGPLYVDGVAINAFDIGVLLDGSSTGYIEHAIITGDGMVNGVELTGDSSQNILSDVYISGASGPAITCGTGTFDNRVDNIAFIDIAGSQAVQDQGTNNYINELYGLGGNTDTRYDSRKELVASVTWQPCTMEAGGASAEDVLVPGATMGDQVIVGPPYNVDWCLFSGYVRAPNTVRILVFNLGPSSLSLASGAWKVRVLN